MTNSRVFLCGGAEMPASVPETVQMGKLVRLNTTGADENVHLRFQDIVPPFPTQVDDRLVDMMELASYVYAADCETARSSSNDAWDEDGAVEDWHRDFHFVIPVREVAFWSDRDTVSLLCNLLNFLSDDHYTFQFIKLADNSRAVQEYFPVGSQSDWPSEAPDRVIMFSGGLDSLAGSLDTFAQGESAILVSHRPVSVLDNRQRQLAAELKRRFPGQVHHVSVKVNKDSHVTHEYTQRTRSFLFTALGTVVAKSSRAGGVRFFENGVVSLNLPVADEVLRARASRTTHPKALYLLQDLCRKVTNDPEFSVDNPFLLNTKTDVVSIIARHKASDLIALTCSCAHGFWKARSKRHCGGCSQCIDRRIAIVAAGLEDYDPQSDYITDVFVGPRSDGYEQNMAVDYVRHGLELFEMSEEVIAAKFNAEISRAVRHMPNRNQAEIGLVDLHKRHGRAVHDAVTMQLERYAEQIIEGSLPPTSLLAMVSGQKHRQSSWSRYCDHLSSLLKRGIPVLCQTEKPKNEIRFQELCDGILKAHKVETEREFPFMQWSSVLTKADWSVEDANLQVEAKYIRTKADIHPISEAIAADITKYGDNGQHVLYIVYDPHHRIVSDSKFSEPIHRRGMRVEFIR